MRRVLNIVRQIGFDPIKFIVSLSVFPRYFRDLFLYLRQKPSGKFQLAPTFQDFGDEAGSAKGHYFWQDLLVAQLIHKKNPQKHIDVGSRIDGFVAHILSFRQVDLIDVRPLSLEIPGLRVLLSNAQENLVEKFGTYDSVSSLHSIEHFGLGRYSDPIDKDGHLKGLLNISALVAPGGFLYVSFPIGMPLTQFNSQRILHPTWPMEILSDFELEQFVLIPWKEEPVHHLLPFEIDLEVQGQCGLYVFRRFDKP